METTLPEIVSTPDVMLGKPRIAGTRITVELLLGKLAAGETPEELYLDYPHIPAGSIAAVLNYAAAVVRKDIDPPSRHCA
jgi:uncharacterized protein (DUF433 family)